MKEKIYYTQVKGGKNDKMKKKRQEQVQITKRFTQEVVEEIISLEDNEGVSAESVLNKARNRNSALHDFFEWDDTTAGEQWRLQQARILINEVKITVGDEIISRYENVSIKTMDGSNERIYKPLIEILSNEDYRKQIVLRALNHQKYWADQYKQYSELKPIISSIKKTGMALNKKWQKKK